MPFAPTRAIVVGSDSGIGRAVAIAYAREGADVALSYLEAEQDDAESTAELVRAAGRTAVLRRRRPYPRSPTTRSRTTSGTRCST